MEESFRSQCWNHSAVIVWSNHSDSSFEKDNSTFLRRREIGITRFCPFLGIFRSGHFVLRSFGPLLCRIFARGSTQKLIGLYVHRMNNF
jgi:hypothetical protein